MMSHLLMVSLSACTISVLFSKPSSVPMSSRLFSTYSSIRIRVSGLIFRYLIHMELNFLQCDKYESIYILLHVVIKFV